MQCCFMPLLHGGDFCLVGFFNCAVLINSFKNSLLIFQPPSYNIKMTEFNCFIESALFLFGKH